VENSPTLRSGFCGKLFYAPPGFGEENYRAKIVNFGGLTKKWLAFPLESFTFGEEKADFSAR